MSAPGRRVYAHADLDSFFASVETALDPALGRRPMAVTGGGRSVVLSATYPARAQGVRAGMPVPTALRACPTLLVVPARIDAYRLAGRAVFNAISQAGGELSQLSIDEASWDVTDITGIEATDSRPGAAAGQWARQMVRARFGLPLSVGVAGSRSSAKIACSHAKPDGLLVVPDDSLSSFLDPLPASSIPGVGPVTAGRLHEVGIETIADLRRAQPAALAASIGRAHADHLLQAAAGVDVAPPPQKGRSMGAERTFREDLRASARTQGFEAVLLEALSRLGASGLAVRTVTVTERTSDGAQRSKSITLDATVSDPQPLAAAARRAFSHLPGPTSTLLGVSFSGLTDHGQGTLPLVFSDPPIEVPPLREPTLAECAYVGMGVDHSTFGHGTVVGLRDDMVGVRFADRVRVLDVNSTAVVRASQAPDNTVV